MVFSFDASAREPASGPCEREMIRASRKHDVPLPVLYAVALTESGRRGVVQPFAMNIDGAAYFASSKDEAIRKFDEARRNGARFVDLGCMQINHRFHGHRFASVDDMLNPSRNVDYAAAFLKELRAREGNWTSAVARYHAGPRNHAAQKRYVCAVIRRIVDQGLGEWTPGARAFCGEA